MPSTHAASATGTKSGEISSSTTTQASGQNQQRKTTSSTSSTTTNATPRRPPSSAAVDLPSPNEHTSINNPNTTAQTVVDDMSQLVQQVLNTLIYKSTQNLQGNLSDDLLNG